MYNEDYSEIDSVSVASQSSLNALFQSIILQYSPQEAHKYRNNEDTDYGNKKDIPTSRGRKWNPW